MDNCSLDRVIKQKPSEEFGEDLQGLDWRTTQMNLWHGQQLLQFRPSQ